MWAIEAEGSGSYLPQADATVHAGEVLREQKLLSFNYGDQHYSSAQLQGGLHRIGETTCLLLALHGHPIDHRLDGMLLILVQVELLRKVVYAPVDPHPDIARLSQVLKDPLVLPLTVFD